MKINKIIVYQYKKPFILQFTSSQTSRKQAASIIVTLLFDNQIIGFGECTPRHYVTGESISTVVKAIQSCFSQILFSSEICSFSDVENILVKLESECIKKGYLNCNAALSSIDIALLDALGKYQKNSLTDYFGPIVRSKIPYSISIPILPLKKISKLYSHMNHIQFSNIKVLVDVNEEENIKRVELVRSLFGNKAVLRLDANCSWTFRQAVSNTERLIEHNIAAIEQPLSQHDIDGLLKYKNKFNIPVILDESICTLADAQHLIDKNACDIINIKISKCGGFIRSNKIANFAQSRGLSCQLGAHVGESAILQNAGSCFAMITPNLIFFDGHSNLLFKDFKKKNLDSFNQIKVIRSPGIGIAIDAEAFQLIQKDAHLISEITPNTV